MDARLQGGLTRASRLVVLACGLVLLAGCHGHIGAKVHVTYCSTGAPAEGTELILVDCEMSHHNPVPYWHELRTDSEGRAEVQHVTSPPTRDYDLVAVGPDGELVRKHLGTRSPNHEVSICLPDSGPTGPAVSRD